MPTRAPAQCWIYQTSGTSNILRSISFADSLHGIMFGGGSTPFTTSDGGSTWIAHEPIYFNAIIYDVVMTDSMTAYAVSDRLSIFKSTDGGNYWIHQRGGGMENSRLYSASFFNYYKGIALGEGNIFYTTNAGQLWHQAGVSFSFSDVAWIDSVTAVAIGHYGNVFRTTNYGQTWTQPTDIVNTLKAISFCNLKVGVIVGGKNIYRTTNAGINWSIQTTIDGVDLEDVSFYNETLGFAVGTNGTILVTADAGITWEAHQSPVINYHHVSFSKNGDCHVVGDGGTVLRSINDCSSYGLQIVAPPDGFSNLTLEQNDNQRSALLKWDFIPNIRIQYIGIKVSLDSSLMTNLLIDTCFPTSQQIVKSFSACNLAPNASHYWRLDLKTSDSIIASSSDIATFTTAGGIINGRVFYDLNRNSMKDEDDYFIERTLLVGGKINANIHASISGFFTISGVDSGIYTISNNGYSIWRNTVPTSGSYTVQLGLNDTADGIDFGCYFPWNSMNGIVFHDFNENGVREDLEPGLAGWSVRFISPLGAESTHTDLEGYYNFSNAPIGECTVKVNVQPDWEQIYPRLNKPLAYTFYSYDNNLSSDFSIHKIPSRIKFSLRFNDNRGSPFVLLHCGVRPNTGAGIWGVDDDCTNADYAEGEFEIPPLFPGGFDARFVRPPFSSSGYGYGSWTDIRPYTAPSQIDTYYVRFSAGTIDGGNYPVTFRWSKELIQSSYTGNVDIEYSQSKTIDMKLNDSLVIADSNVYILRLIAGSPGLQFRWRMVSVSMEVPDARKEILYANAITPAYAFEEVYVEKETLSNGVGYWLKCDDSETFPMIGNTLLEDTFDVAEGWNMIGSISVPVNVINITSLPPGMITSEFFGHTVQYVLVDTIQPGRGYWVKAGQAGRLILASNGGERSAAERIKIVPTSELPPAPPGEEKNDQIQSILPSKIILHQNNPNPFNTITTISYSLPHASEVLLRIYNILGQEIARLVDGIDPAGLRIVRWDASGVASGVYLYRLETITISDKGTTLSQVRKMLLIK